MTFTHFDSRPSLARDLCPSFPTAGPVNIKAFVLCSSLHSSFIGCYLPDGKVLGAAVPGVWSGWEFASSSHARGDCWGGKWKPQPQLLGSHGAGLSSSDEVARLGRPHTGAGLPLGEASIWPGRRGWLGHPGPEASTECSGSALAPLVIPSGSDEEGTDDPQALDGHASVF